MDFVKQISADPRVRVRRTGSPDREGRCVVYWMQRSQRGVDNPALDVAVELGAGRSGVERDRNVTLGPRVGRQQLPIVRQPLEHRDVEALIRLIRLGIIDPDEVIERPRLQRG